MKTALYGDNWDDDIKQVLDEELGDVTCNDPVMEDDL